MHRIPTYTILYWAAVIVALVNGGILIVQAADPLTLGFSPIQARWLTVLNGFTGLIASFLPRPHKWPSDDRRGLD